MASASVSRNTLFSQIRNRTAVASSRFVSTLIVAEPTDDDTLAPATLSTITAAQKLHDGPIALLTNSSAPSALPSGISTVITTNLPSILAESMSEAIQAAHTQHSFTHILAPATKFGANVIPRAAALIEASPITDVMEVVNENTFVRPMYAGNVLAKVQSTEDVKVLSIRSTAFEKAPVVEESLSSANVETLELKENTLSEFVGAHVSKSDRPELGSASTVVSGGRGLKSGENFELLEKLADKLKAAVGASRAAVDAGFVPNDWQVGQTGKVVAPDLYIAVSYFYSMSQIQNTTVRVHLQILYVDNFLFLIGRLESREPFNTCLE